jgi:hypothetical protein
MKWNNKIGLWWIILLNSVFSVEFKHDSSSSLNSGEYGKNHWSRSKNYKSLGKTLKTLGIMTLMELSPMAHGQSATYNRMLEKLQNIYVTGNENIISQTLSVEDYNTFKSNYPNAFEYPTTLQGNCTHVNLNILDEQMGSFADSIDRIKTCKTQLIPKYYTYIHGSTKIPCLNPMTLSDWENLDGNRIENIDFPQNDKFSETSCKTSGFIRGVCDRINGPSLAPGSDLFNGALCYPTSRTLTSSDTCSIQLRGLTGTNQILNGQVCSTYNLQKQTLTSNNEIIKFFNENTGDLKLESQEKSLRYTGIINNQTLTANTKESNWLFQGNLLDLTPKDTVKSYKINFNTNNRGGKNEILDHLEYGKGSAILTTKLSSDKQNTRLKIMKDHFFLSETNKKIVKKNEVDILDEETQGFLQFVINNQLENSYGDVVTKSITAEGLTDYLFEDLNHKILIEYLSFKFKMLKNELILINWKALLKDFRTSSSILTSEQKFNYFLEFFTGKTSLADINNNSAPVVVNFLDKDITVNYNDLIEVINNFTNIFSSEQLLLNEDLVKVFVENPSDNTFKYLNRNSCRDYKFVNNILKSVDIYANDIANSKKLASQAFYNLFSSSLKKSNLYNKYIAINDNDLILNDKILSGHLYELLKYEMVCSSTPNKNSILFTKKDLMDFVYEKVINLFNKSNLNLLLYPHKDSYLLNQDPSNFYIAKLKNNQLNTLTGAIRDDLIVNKNSNPVVKTIKIPKDPMELLFENIMPSSNFIITKDNIKQDLLVGLKNLRLSMNNLNYIKKRNGVVLTVMLMERVLQFINVLATETYTESYYQNVYGVFDNHYSINYLNDGSTTGRIPLLSKFPVIEKIFKSMEPLLYSCGNKYIDFNVDDFFNSALDNIICNVSSMDNIDVEKKGYEIFNDMTKILNTLFPNGSDVDALPAENQNFLKFIIMLRDMKVEESSTKGTSVFFTLLDNFLPVVLKMDQYFNTQPHLKSHISSIQLLYLHLNEMGQKYLLDKARSVDGDYNDYLKHKKLTTELTNRNNNWIPSYLYYAPTIDTKQTLIGSEWVKNWNVLLSYLAKEILLDSSNFLDLVLKDNVLFIENKYFDNRNIMDYETYNINKNTMGFSLSTNFSSLNEVMIIKNSIGLAHGRQLGLWDFVSKGYKALVKGVNYVLDCGEFCKAIGIFARSPAKSLIKTGLSIFYGNSYSTIAYCGQSTQDLLKTTLRIKDELIKTPKNTGLINDLNGKMQLEAGFVIGNCSNSEANLILSPVIDILSGNGTLGGLSAVITNYLGSSREEVAVEIAQSLNNTLKDLNKWYTSKIAVNDLFSGFFGKTFSDFLAVWFINFRRVLSIGSDQTMTDYKILQRIREQHLNMFFLDAQHQEYLPGVNDFPKCYNYQDQLITGDAIAIPVIFLAAIISFSLVEKSKSFSPLLGMLKPIFQMKLYNCRTNAMTDFKNLYKYAIKNNFLSYGVIQLVMDSIMFNYMNYQLDNNCSNYHLNKDYVASKIAFDVAYIAWNLILYKGMKKIINSLSSDECCYHKKRLKALDCIINFALITAHTGIDITIAVDLNNELPKIYRS